jgi:hypothetical protein
MSAVHKLKRPTVFSGLKGATRDRGGTPVRPVGPNKLKEEV